MKFITLQAHYLQMLQKFNDEKDIKNNRKSIPVLVPSFVGERNAQWYHISEND